MQHNRHQWAWDGPFIRYGLPAILILPEELLEQLRKRGINLKEK
jgi:hypothetical protein